MISADKTFTFYKQGDTMNNNKKISFALAASFLLLPTAVPIVNAEDNDSVFLSGDINSDGEFNVADVAVFQRWLLGDSFYGDDIKLNNWKAADLCNDGRLDVFDLCLMKQELLKNGKPAELPTLIEISEMINEEATELFSKNTFQDIECIWGKFDIYFSGLYGGGWEIEGKSIDLSFDYYTQKLDRVSIQPTLTEDDYIRSFIRQKVNSPYQTVERFTSTIYSTEEYNLKNRVTSITVYGVDGEIMTSGELRSGVAKTVVVCYDENKRLEYEVMY
ncbi:MAG: dockerin type I repeat-containing protein [Ruminococcus sp.]|nr:dockerin type I repeat-containing protein [Ruminococcus sp.]